MSLREMFETRGLRPLADFVAIERIVADKVSPGGIIIPDTVAEKYRAFEGIVAAVGPGRIDSKGVRWPAPDLKPGDRVVFGRYAGAESSLQDEDYWLVRYEEIHGVMEELP